MITIKQLKRIGEELITSITDRDFSGAGNWTGTNWSLNTGRFLHSAGVNVATLDAYPAVVGRHYELLIDITTGTTGTLIINYGGINSVTFGGSSGTIRACIIFYTTSSTAKLTITPNASWVGLIDNVSLKELYPPTDYDTINIQGNSKKIPKKFGFISKTSIQGSIQQKHIGIKNKLTVNIDKIYEDDYKSLVDLWSNEEYVYITTENKEFLKCVFVSDTLDLDSDTDYDGNIFYYGSIEFED